MFRAFGTAPSPETPADFYSWNRHLFDRGEYN